MKNEDVQNGDNCQYCGQEFMLPGEGVKRTCNLCATPENRPDPKPIDLDKRPA